MKLQSIVILLVALFLSDQEFVLARDYIYHRPELTPTRALLTNLSQHSLLSAIRPGG